MKFAPDNKPDRFRMFIDTNKFITNMNLKKYFMGIQKHNLTMENVVVEKETLFEAINNTSKCIHSGLKSKLCKLKSDFIPNVSNNECIDTFRRQITNGAGLSSWIGKTTMPNYLDY